MSLAIEDEKILIVEKEALWIKELQDYLTSRKLPENKAIARSIRRRATRYTIIRGTIYGRFLLKPLYIVLSNQLHRTSLQRYTRACVAVTKGPGY